MVLSALIVIRMIRQVLGSRLDLGKSETGCNQKEFSVLIGVQCVMILVRIVLICSFCVVKVCFVGNVLAYGAL
jgi:hypothetical protein